LKFIVGGRVSNLSVAVLMSVAALACGLQRLLFANCWHL
jgi:hypothetical protein